MAKRSNEPAASPERAKIRVFCAEVEGNNESVQEALKTMVLAMSRPVRVISGERANGKASVLLEQTDLEEVGDEVEELEEGPSADEDSTFQSSRKPRGTGKKVDRNAGLELVPDLNFRPDGKQSLKEFVEEKAPKAMWKQ